MVPDTNGTLGNRASDLRQYLVRLPEIWINARIKDIGAWPKLLPNHLFIPDIGAWP